MKFEMDRFIYNCWMRRLEMINGVFTLKLLVVIQKAMTEYQEKQHQTYTAAVSKVDALKMNKTLRQSMK